MSTNLEIKCPGHTVIPMKIYVIEDGLKTTAYKNGLIDQLVPKQWNKRYFGNPPLDM